MTKIRVGLIFGGCSLEHEVSLQSAKCIVNSIDKNKFEVIMITINKNGQWCIVDSAFFFNKKNKPIYTKIDKFKKNVFLSPSYQLSKINSINQLKNFLLQIDVVFPIIHGTTGEDGSLQGLLRMFNIPYVGSNVLGSAISMDKDISKRLLRDKGLAITPFIVIKNKEYNISFKKIITQLGLPLFIKPANQGSSIGVSKVIDKRSFNQALILAFNFDYKILIETAITGREIECAVLGNDKPKASLCGEIILGDNFYSYENKYVNKLKSKIVIPANIDQKISNKIRNIAIQSFLALNCIGMARVDVFLTNDNKIFVNEVNTIPGFTEESMYPKLWQESGLSYSDLITYLIELALEHYQKK